MRKFTDKEKALARQVAEVMEHNPRVGDYYFYAEIPKVYLVDSDIDVFALSDIGVSTSIWLPLEHDCLEFLCKKSSEVKLIFRDGVWVCRYLDCNVLRGRFGKTALEALYRVTIEEGQ